VLVLPVMLYQPVKTSIDSLIITTDRPLTKGEHVIIRYPIDIGNKN
jgi:hypothetical protein